MKQLPIRARSDFAPATTRSVPNGNLQEAKAILLQVPTAAAAFTWPQWARRARLAGAYFHPGEIDAVIAARLDLLSAQHFCGLVADSTLGAGKR